MNKHIEQAIENLRNAATRYERPERYYNGEHDLRFATEKFESTFGTLFREFALNLCPVVCDAVRDKLRITGFSLDSLDAAEPPYLRKSSAFPSLAANDHGGSASKRGGTAPGKFIGGDGKPQAFRTSSGEAAGVETLSRSIWHRNRMATRSGEVHKEALKTGDAFVIVWPDAAGRAAIHPNRAANITAVYDEDSPGRIAWAAKTWRAADKRVRLNLFYPDRIEKYISKAESEGSLPAAKEFAPLGSRGVGEKRSGGRTNSSTPALLHSSPVIPNPFGIVPVFHFANNADLGSPGRSELEAAIPVQDGLNKSVLDMLVAMEFSAFRQRWVAGIEVDYDEAGKAVQPYSAGVEKLWVASNSDARFGDFEAAALDQFLKVKDSFRVDIASVTGTPLHYFLQQTGDFPSGESLRRSETRFLAKVRDRQESFGQVWADVMAFALQIDGHPPTQLITEWEDPSPISERERLENLLLKKQLGLPAG
ncbi:MAG: phage portal protein, partial [Pyrinomonadaceae bacterium]